MMQTPVKAGFGYRSVRYFKYLHAKLKYGPDVLWKNSEQEDGANLYNNRRSEESRNIPEIPESTVEWKPSNPK
jgi:hypothetical protein